MTIYFLFYIKAITWSREKYFRDAIIDEILRRIGIKLKLNENEEIKKLKYSNKCLQHCIDTSSTIKTEMTCLPQIQRIIPSEDPIYGGIEVTILGKGFIPGLECKFGDFLSTTIY